MKIALILFPMYAFLAVVFYWLAISTLTFPTYALVHKITTTVVEAGHFIHFDTQFYRYASCRVSRSQFLQKGSTQIRLSSEEYYIKADISLLDVQNLVSVPRDVTPGRYQFYVQTTYFCNPMDYFIARSKSASYGEVEITSPKSNKD